MLSTFALCLLTDVSAVVTAVKADTAVNCVVDFCSCDFDVESDCRYAKDATAQCDEFAVL